MAMWNWQGCKTDEVRRIKNVIITQHTSLFVYRAKSTHVISLVRESDSHMDRKQNMSYTEIHTF